MDIAKLVALPALATLRSATSRRPAIGNVQ